LLLSIQAVTVRPQGDAAAVAAREEGRIPMKYLLTFVVDEGAIEDTSMEEMREAMERWNAFDEEATEKGALIACEPLEGSSAATTIRIRENEDRRAGEAGGVSVRRSRWRRR
jgi:hypothetical protein